MNSIKFISGDSVVFVALHVGLFLLVLYALWCERKMKSDMVRVKRGKDGWNNFYLAYGILSVIVIQIISISEYGKGYKVLITIIDLGLLLYLAFFKCWFRNKTIGFIVESQTKEE
jgi:hypothetical protein